MARSLVAVPNQANLGPSMGLYYGARSKHDVDAAACCVKWRESLENSLSMQVAAWSGLCPSRARHSSLPGNFGEIVFIHESVHGIRQDQEDTKH